MDVDDRVGRCRFDDNCRLYRVFAVGHRQTVRLKLELSRFPILALRPAVLGETSGHITAQLNWPGARTRNIIWREDEL